MRSTEALEPVADPAHRLQRAGALTELAPQRAHDDFHDVRAAGPVIAPDVPQQRCAPDGEPLALLQVAQDVELEPGQGDVAPVEDQPPAGGLADGRPPRARRARSSRRTSAASSSPPTTPPSQPSTDAGPMSLSRSVTATPSTTIAPSTSGAKPSGASAGAIVATSAAAT